MRGISLGVYSQTPTASGAFSVLSLPGLQTWIKPDNLVSSNGGALATYTERSTNGYVLTLADTTLQYNIVNGKKVLRMAAAGTNITFPTGGARMMFANVSGGAIYAVIKTNSIGAGSWLYQCTANANANTRLGLGYTDSLTNRVGGRRLDTDSFLSASKAMTNGSWVIESGILNYSTGNCSYYRNTTLEASNTSFHSGGSTQNSASLEMVAMRGLSGDLAELIICNQPHDATTRGQVETYLNSEYALY